MANAKTIPHPCDGRKAATAQAKPPLMMCSLTLTQADVALLLGLGQDASDVVGRRVSSSAVARALLRWAKQQGAAWARAEIFPLIEEEQRAGVLWGKKK